MSGHAYRSCADRRRVEAKFADLQRQIDDLSGQLQALTYLVHVHTIASLRAAPPSDACPPAAQPVEAGDD